MMEDNIFELLEVTAMEQSPFVNNFPLTFKICTFLDVKTKQFNNNLLFLRFFSNVFFLFSTLSCMYENGGVQQDSFSKSHDLLLFLIFLSNEIFLVTNKTEVCTLIEFLTEPLGDFASNSVHSKIAEDYIREVNFYGKVVTTFFVVSGSFWSVAPLLFLAHSEKAGNRECAHLALGWVWKYESYFYMLPVYFASTFVCIMAIAIVFLWYLVMVYMIIKIKFKIRLLCANLDGINKLMDIYEEHLQAGDNATSVISEEDLLVRIVPANNEEGRQVNPKKVINSNEIEIQKYFRAKILRGQIKMFLEKVVEQHVDIIKYTRLADENFRLSVMVYVQLGVIIVALAIPKIGLGAMLLSPDYIHRGVEVIGMMAFMGVFNYFGQIILDESETLRQTLYNCDWTNKALGLRRGLLIMQTMATKPLKLSVGGIYTLGMETYGNIASAAYSYTSLLQSLSVGED